MNVVLFSVETLRKKVNSRILFREIQAVKKQELDTRQEIHNKQHESLVTSALLPVAPLSLQILKGNSMMMNALWGEIKY